MSDPYVELVTRDGLERRIGDIQSGIDLNTDTKARIEQIVGSVYAVSDAVVMIGGKAVSGVVLSPASNPGTPPTTVTIGGQPITGMLVGGTA